MIFASMGIMTNQILNDLIKAELPRPLNVLQPGKAFLMLYCMVFLKVLTPAISGRVERGPAHVVRELDGLVSLLVHY